MSIKVELKGPSWGWGTRKAEVIVSEEFDYDKQLIWDMPCDVIFIRIGKRFKETSTFWRHRLIPSTLICCLFIHHGDNLGPNKFQEKERDESRENMKRSWNAEGMRSRDTRERIIAKIGIPRQHTCPKVIVSFTLYNVRHKVSYFHEIKRWSQSQHK